jgi:hypothetical protein
MKINNWTEHIQDRVKWKEAIEKTKTFLKQWSCSAWYQALRRHLSGHAEECHDKASGVVAVRVESDDKHLTLLTLSIFPRVRGQQ